MDYTGHNLKKEFIVDKIYTVHYFEYPNLFDFEGEAHNFWEFVYVDKGEIVATRNDEKLVLTQGSIIFHKPCEWHSIATNNAIASNVVIVSFECRSKAMSFFENKITTLGQNQKNIISKIITEYKNSFSTPLNDIYTYKLDKNPNQVIGSEQLLGMYLCEFLISFLRGQSFVKSQSLIDINLEGSILKSIKEYMVNNIGNNITLKDISLHTGTNRTKIINIFKKNHNMGAIEYYIHLKIEKAKELLRDGEYNVTQISRLLGYSNIHFFSRQFKSKTGMSPIEYSSSIKAMNKTI